METVVTPGAPARQLGREDPEPYAGDRLLHRREGGVRQDPPGEEGGVEAGEVVYVRDDCARRPGNVRVVAAVVEIRQPPRLRQLGVLEPERTEMRCSSSFAYVRPVTFSMTSPSAM